MLKKLRETKLDISVKSALVILVLVFIVTFFLARWIESGSQTIAQSMVLHREDTKVTEKQKQYHYDMTLKKHKLLFNNIDLPRPLTIPKPAGVSEETEK